MYFSSSDVAILGADQDESLYEKREEREGGYDHCRGPIIATHLGPGVCGCIRVSAPGAKGTPKTII